MCANAASQHFSRILHGRSASVAKLKPTQAQLGALMMTPLWFNGKFACDYRVEDTRTKKNCNGGSVIRTNMFIKMDKARILQEEDS